MTAVAEAAFDIQAAGSWPQGLALPLTLAAAEASFRDASFQDAARA
jgi:hypothetical protein